MASDLVIMGVKGSPFVRKVQVALAEKGVEYEIEPVMPFPPPEWYVAINPAKRIPTLRDRSVGSEGIAGTIPDSSPICAYIERKHPEPSLYPKEDFAYARALWFEEYADTELAGRVGAGFFRPLVMSAMRGRDPDVATARRFLAEEMPPLFDYLERSIEGREFLVGDAFSIADIAVATHFVNYFLAEAPLDAGRWPRLADYVARMHARPSFAACWEAERRLFPPKDLAL
jgi:glutathione S-transferase